MMDLGLRRRFFAEEIEAVARLRTPALVEALATVPRERFLPPGPWSVLSDTGMAPAQTCLTADDDPGRVLHNIAVAIDPQRQLFNGQPSAVAAWIDALNLTPGSRAVHVGCGLGYYSAVMAACVGAQGRVVAFEADERLAAQARINLEAFGVEVRGGDSGDPRPGEFDAILVNAGVTHPLEAWLDALRPGGRLMVPLTSTLIPMGPIGKGLAFLVEKSVDKFAARALGVVAIYTAVGLRDPDLNERIGKALMAGPQRWAAVTRMRRDPHEPTAACWLHAETFCLSS